ncbi:MAG: serine/threonine protein kinase, partial [bacterium]|nr:serine/threonine protein kinase [bacterium]
MSSNDHPRSRDEETADTAVARPAPPRPEGAAGGPPGLARGTTLGRYVVLHHLGSGGVGMVYAAYDPELDRKVAVKLLRDDLFPSADEDGGQARLLREAQALARLSHPNVLTVFDVGTYNDQVFVATELVEGCTLKDWLHEKPRSWKEVLKLFLDAGRGLAAAHATGLVHRDVKPANVLLGADGRVRVMDFGLARTAVVTSTEDAPPGAGKAGEIPVPDSATASEMPPTPGLLSSGITRTGSLMGTPAYMAPEQFRGEAFDARTDQYGFCVALYEGLYGERPFAAESPHLLVLKVSKGEINDPPPGKRVPPWLRQILLRGLSRRPDDRYPSMEALLRDLEAAPKRARRRWWWAAAFAALLVAALVVRQLLAPSPWLRPGEVTRVALLPFHNATGDPRHDWVEVGLTEMVAQTLHDTRGVAVVPSAQVSAALEDLNLGARSEPADSPLIIGSSWPPQTLERFQAALGSHLVVATAVTREHEMFKLHYAMLGSGGSRRLRIVQGTELMASASQLASRLSRLLNPQAPPQSLEQHFSDDPFVNRAFAVGLQQLDIGGPKVAEHYFEICLDQDPSLDRARLALARVSLNQTDFQRSEALLATVLESAERQGDRGLVAEVLYLRGLMARIRGELEHAATLITRALELHRELAESDQVIADLTALGRVAQDRGEWDKARPLYEQARELAGELGARSAEAELVRNLGLLALFRGDLDRAEQLLRQALESYREQGHRAGTVLTLGNL